jgi:hypothetical protein
MTPPHWHTQVLDLAQGELSRMDDPRESQPILMFVKHGEVHMRVFYSDATDADEPSQVDIEVYQRLGLLQGTSADAYATARLVVWNGESGKQSWAISISGAEADAPNESTWLQLVEFDGNGKIRRKDLCVHTDAGRENVIKPWNTSESAIKPKKAVDSTATRVTPPANPSLRSGQESHHGQP